MLNDPSEFDQTLSHKNLNFIRPSRYRAWVELELGLIHAGTSRREGLQTGAWIRG